MESFYSPQQLARQPRLAVKRAQKRAWYERNRTQMRARNKQRRRAFSAKLAEIKGGVCEECGDTFPAKKLHFHHIDPATKEFEVGQAYTRAWSRVVEEIAKCRVLCARCHNIVEPKGFVLSRG